MCQREEADHDVVLVGAGQFEVDEGGAVGDDVPVGQHDALRSAGRARRIADRRQILRCGRLKFGLLSRDYKQSLYGNSSQHIFTTIKTHYNRYRGLWSVLGLATEGLQLFERHDANVLGGGHLLQLIRRRVASYQKAQRRTLLPLFLEQR